MIKLTICTFACLVVTCIVLVAHAADEKYSNKYDDIDIKAVLDNPRSRNQYLGCITDTSPCITGSARYLKGVNSPLFFSLFFNLNYWKCSKYVYGVILYINYKLILSCL